MADAGESDRDPAGVKIGEIAGAQVNATRSVTGSWPTSAKVLSSSTPDSVSVDQNLNGLRAITMTENELKTASAFIFGNKNGRLSGYASYSQLTDDNSEIQKITGEDGKFAGLIANELKPIAGMSSSTIVMKKHSLK